jgi:hypothetical protein
MAMSSFCLACSIAIILILFVNIGIRKDIAKQQPAVQKATLIQQASRVLLQEIAAASPRNPEFVDLLQRYGVNINDNRQPGNPAPPQP